MIWINSFHIFTQKKVLFLINNILDDLAEKYKRLNIELVSDINLKGWKGKSGIQIVRFPKLFKIIEYRKDEPDSKPREHVTKIPIDVFNRMLAVLSELHKNQRFSVKYISELYCRKYGMYEFLNPKFDYSKLFGSRKIYLKKIYYPLKIAEYYGYIKYEKRGFITRISDKIEVQTRF